MLRIGRLSLALALPLSLGAANYVFLFNNLSSTAAVYDADSLAPLATPTVGVGAVKAFGVPNASSPSQFSKFYVVTNSSIKVLDPSLAVLATLPLSGSLAQGPNAAVLSPDGLHLLVAAGSQVQVVNTGDSPDAIYGIPLPSPPTGIAVTPNSTRAYVMMPNSSAIQILDLSQNLARLISTTVGLPSGALPTAIGMAPNGSKLYVATPGSIYDIDRISNTFTTAISSFFGGVSSIAFDRDPPVNRAVFNGGSSAAILNIPSRTVGVNFTVSGANINKMVLPGANRALLLAGAGQRLYLGFLSAGGFVSELTNPQTGLPYGDNAADMDASPDGARLFVAFSDSRLIKLDPSGLVASNQISTTTAPSGLSVIYAPATLATVLEVYGGNNQGTTGGTLSMPLAVRARSSNPAFLQTVNFSSTSSGVSFSAPTTTTNLQGVAETFVSVPDSGAVQVTATVSGGAASQAVFNLNGESSNPQALIKVSGDDQFVLHDTPFPANLVIQAAPGAILTATLPPSSVAFCTHTTADANGIGTISCTAGAAGATSVNIQVSDSNSNTLADPFHVTVVAAPADLPNSLSVEATTVLTGPVRSSLQDALQVLATKPGGGSVSGAGVYFGSQQDVVVSPSPVVTTLAAATASVTFGCFVGNGALVAVLQAPGLPQQTISFTTTPGPVAQITKKQGDNQRGSPGQLLNGPGQALLVQLSDVCGHPLSGQPVTWTVSPSGAATLENVVNVSDFQGNSSVLVHLGARGGAFTVTGSSNGVSAIFNLSVNAVATKLLLASGDKQNVVVGQAAAQPLVVEVTDDSGVDIPGVSVTFAVTAGAATLSAAQATTDATGHASTNVTGGNAVGAITITATAISKTVTFTITIVGRAPTVSTLGFVDGASFRVGWVPGGLGSIFGVGITEGISGVAQAGQAPFPTLFRGVKITIGGVNAPIISLVNIQGQEQINLQVPFEVPPGTTTVVITNNGSTATFTGVQVVAVLPAVFEFADTGGVSLAAALHADYSVVTQANPARKGEVLQLFLTGMGATLPPVGTNVAGPVPPAATVLQPLVGFSGGSAQVLGSFYAPTLYTAYQINFVVPANSASGLVNMAVIANSVTSKQVRVPVQ